MDTATLACPGVRANVITDGKFCAGLTPPPPPAGNVPLLPPLGVVPVDGEEEINLVDLDILSVVTLRKSESLVFINKVNLKYSQCRYLL